jgi:hypothetical protein
VLSPEIEHIDIAAEKSATTMWSIFVAESWTNCSKWQQQLQAMQIQ